MDDLFLIAFLYNFFVNEMLGNLQIFVIFIFIIIMGLFFIAKSPKAGIVLFGLGLVVSFSTADYIIPKWVTGIVYAAAGLIWAAIILKAARDGFD